MELGIDLREFYPSVEWDILGVPAERHEKYYPCCAEPYPGEIRNIKTFIKHVQLVLKLKMKILNYHNYNYFLTHYRLFREIILPFSDFFFKFFFILPFQTYSSI